MKSQVILHKTHSNNKYEALTDAPIYLPSRISFSLLLSRISRHGLTQHAGDRGHMPEPSNYLTLSRRCHNMIAGALAEA